MNLDRSHTDTKTEGNDLVWLPGHKRLKNLPLAWTERIDQRRRHSNIIGPVHRRAGLQRGLNRRYQGVVTVGLFNEVDSTRLHRADRGLHVTLSRHHNDRQVRVYQPKTSMNLEAVHLRHTKIQQDAAPE